MWIVGSTTHVAGWWFQIFCIFTLFGEDSHFDEHICQMGWFNHQLGGFSSHPP